MEEYSQRICCSVLLVENLILAGARFGLRLSEMLTAKELQIQGLYTEFRNQ